MNTASDQELPPLVTLQAALSRITETLASAIARPTDAAPDWSESEWLLARAVSTIHGVSPLLSRTLHWQAPPGWQEFLQEQRTHTENRHVRIQELLDQLHDAARRADIALVALKGAALHSLGLYIPGERPMADIDLLVREQDSLRARRMIEGLGFHLTHTNWKHQAFAANDETAPAVFGEHSTNSMKIELHDGIREQLPLRGVDVSRCVFPKEGAPGLNDYPSLAALMMHLLLHAAGAMSLRAVRLIQLNDIARLSASMSSADWDDFLSQEALLDQTLWWSFPPLALTARHFDSIPSRIVNSMSQRCHWWLKQSCRRRTLSDVSLCYLWVEAFPGIEWARSPREMLAYISQRIAPQAHQRSLRKVAAVTELTAAQSNWAHMSQSRRILRWLTTRPARPQALHPIRAALTQPRQPRSPMAQPVATAEI